MVKAGNVELIIKVKLSLWSAIKMRIAGINNVMGKDIKHKKK